MAYKDMDKKVKAMQRCNERNTREYDKIGVLVPKGKRDIIARIAESQGKSVNKLITELLYSSYPEILNEDNSI